MALREHQVIAVYAGAIHVPPASITIDVAVLNSFNYYIMGLENVVDIVDAGSGRYTRFVFSSYRKVIISRTVASEFAL